MSLQGKTSKRFVHERGSDRDTDSGKVRRTAKVTRPTESLDLSIEEALGLFVDAKKAEDVRPRTIQDYRAHISYLTLFLSQSFPEVRLVSELSPAVIRSYILYMKEQRRPYAGVAGREKLTTGLTTNTINIRLRSLSAMCKFWFKEGILSANPMENIRQLRMDKEQDVATFSDEDILKLTQAPDVHSYAGWRDKILMLLLIDTGIRINEAMNIEVNHIDFRNSTLTIPATTAKNRKTREIPLSREVLKMLKELHLETKQYFDEDDHLFMNAYGERLQADTFRRRLWKYAKRLGLTKANPHAFRHYFCSKYIRNGGDIFSLQKIVDHADIKTTRKYIQLTGEHIKEQHNRYSPLRGILRK